MADLSVHDAPIWAFTMVRFPHHLHEVANQVGPAKLMLRARPPVVGTVPVAHENAAHSAEDRVRRIGGALAMDLEDGDGCRRHHRPQPLGDVPPLSWERKDLRCGCILPGRNKTGDASLTPIEPDQVRAFTAWKALSPKTKATDSVFVTLAGEPIDPREATEIYRSSVRPRWSPPGATARAVDASAWGEGAASPRRSSERGHGRTAQRSRRGLVRRRSKRRSPAIDRYRRELGTYRELTLGDWTPLCPSSQPLWRPRM